MEDTEPEQKLSEQFSGRISPELAADLHRQLDEIWSDEPVLGDTPPVARQTATADAEELADIVAYKKAKKKPGKSIPFEEAFK